MSDYGYSEYLRAKRTVDDRALNKDVLAALTASLPRGPLEILEIGAGLGTMVGRLLDRGFCSRARYTLVDVDAQLLRDSREWLATWAKGAGFSCEAAGDSLALVRGEVVWTIVFVNAELSAWVAGEAHQPADLLIANAFLDIVDVPTVLPQLFSRVMKRGGQFLFTINFDGETIFEPAHEADDALMRVYHRSMDQRVRDGRPSGHSRTGRRLFHWLKAAGAHVEAAGSSDWVVFSDAQNQYPHEEATFVRHIIDTIDAELHRHADVDRQQLADWLRARREQLLRGQLVYLAHQLDLCGRAPA